MEKLTPWRHYPQYSEIVNRHGCRIAIVEDEGEAQAILQAVNNHDRLVEMLTKCRNWIENCNQHAQIVKDINQVIKEAKTI